DADDEDDEGTRGTSDDSPGRERDRGDDDDGDRGRPSGEDRGSRTTLQRNGTSYQGATIAFAYEEGTLTNYTVSGVVWFDEITFSPTMTPSELEVERDRFEVDGENGELEARDRADGRLDARSDDGVVVAHLAAGVQASEQGRDRLHLVAPDGTTATLEVEDGYVLREGTLRSEEISLRAHPGAASQREAPTPGSDQGEEAREDRREAARQAQERAFRGSFQQVNGNITGEHVAFSVDDGEIRTYAAGGVTWFANISWQPTLQVDEIKTEGRELEVEGTQGEFKALDNPTGHFKAESEAGNVTLQLADGITARWAKDGSGKRIQLTVEDGPGAFVHASRGLTLAHNNTTIEAPAEVKFSIVPPSAHVREVSEAIQTGAIVAEVVVARNRTTNETGAPEVVPIAHGDVNLTAEQSVGQVTLTIEGHGEGRTLLFNVERDAIGPVEEMVVRFDGERIRAADGLQDVLHATEGEPPEFLVILGANATQVLVQIPSFSVHTVEIQSTPQAVVIPGPVDLIGSAVAFTVAVIGGVAFVGVSWAVRARKP
ncbi:MAG: hypothetical protein R3185_06630, partial [Candidatus Thermoplasmatota archaeon]|nr:hypothetical protein [Candidatus Thermoplasmatota archaeon]